MAARVFLFGSGICLVTIALIAQACGGTEEETPSTVDSGADASPDARPDAVVAADAAEDALTCDPNADFTTKIADASIADGASSTGLCLACTQSFCKPQLDACNENCSCQGVADEALACYIANSGNAFACVSVLQEADVDEETQSIAIGLISCINTACAEACATAELVDGGKKDAN